MKNSTLNLYELADIKTISVYHGLIQFSCFESWRFWKEILYTIRILFSHLIKFECFHIKKSKSECLYFVRNAVSVDFCCIFLILYHW